MGDLNLGVEFVAAFFTLLYVVRLAVFETFSGAVMLRSSSAKRSLMNQEIRKRGYYSAQMIVDRLSA